MPDTDYPPWRKVPASSVRWGWTALGWVLAVIAFLAGLAILAYLILMAVALNNYGSNK